MGKEKLKFNNEMTSLDDKLRIANKVNNKYLELGVEKTKLLEDLCAEVGKEADNIITNCSVIAKEGKPGNYWKPSIFYSGSLQNIIMNIIIIDHYIWLENHGP